MDDDSTTAPKMHPTIPPALKSFEEALLDSEVSAARLTVDKELGTCTVASDFEWVPPH